MDLGTIGAILKQLGIKKLSPQQWAVLSSPFRYKLVSGGIRAGKSFMAALFLVLSIIRTIYDGSAKPGDVYWLIAKKYELTEAEFKYAKSFLRMMGLLGRSSSIVNPGYIELNTCVCGQDGCSHEKIRIKTKSAADEEGIAMEAPRGVVVCEAGQITLEQFWRIEERLIETRGWLYMAGTMEFNVGWYVERFESWKDSPDIQARDNAASFNLPSYSNLAIFPDGEADEEIQRFKRMHAKDWYTNRIEALPIPPRNRVFPQFRNEIHVRPVEFVPNQPVYINADPGYSRQTESAYAVECWQKIEGQIRVFYEFYVQEMTGREVARHMKKQEWWNQCEKTGVIDIAGRQHQAAESQIEVWLEETGLYMNSNTVEISDQLDRMADMLHPDPATNQSAIVFSPQCEGIISEFGGGLNPFTQKEQVYKWPEGRDGEIRGRKPIDKYNHGIKAVTYGIVDAFGFGESIGSNALNRSPGRTIEVAYW